MMKSMRTIELAVATVVIVFLSACASEPASKPEAAPAPRAALPVAPPAPPQAASTRQQSLSGNSMATIDKRSIYYDFDSFALKAEYNTVVEANASYLKQHPDAHVKVEGNCDERGSREYNLALGQRRADSVMKMLELAGVSGGQVEAVSFGKEKPKALGHDEQAWTENRRSDFDYSRQ